MWPRTDTYGKRSALSCCLQDRIRTHGRGPFGHPLQDTQKEYFRFVHTNHVSRKVMKYYLSKRNVEQFSAKNK